MKVFQMSESEYLDERHQQVRLQRNELEKPLWLLQYVIFKNVWELFVLLGLESYEIIFQLNKNLKFFSKK